jgi:hypothetical protein
MLQSGTVINFDENPFLSMGNLYIRKESKKFDIIPFQSEYMVFALKRIYGNSSLKDFMGKPIVYSIDDNGFLAGIGDNSDISWK